MGTKWFPSPRSPQNDYMIYTYSDIKNAVQDISRKTISALTQERPLINRAVREVWSEVDIRTSKRRSNLSPALFQDVYEYAKPTDMKGLGLIDIMPLIDRAQGWRGEFNLTSPEEFDRCKTFYRNMVAIYDADGVGKLLVSAQLKNDSQVTLHNMESLTDNGTWAADGTGATGITTDADQRTEGNRSVMFDVEASQTAANIENATGMTAIDLTDYTDNQIFLWIYIPLTGTELAKLTTLTLRWGSAAGAYYSRTATQNNWSVSFKNGWNLVRFDWDSNVTTAGTADIENIDYLRLALTFSSGLTAKASGFRVDQIVARAGEVHDVVYYSKYPWQSSAGTYLENSTANTDYVNADTDEIDLVAKRLDYLVARANKQRDDVQFALKEWSDGKEHYHLMYPSERKQLITTYHDFSSLGGGLNTGPKLGRFDS